MSDPAAPDTTLPAPAPLEESGAADETPPAAPGGEKLEDRPREIGGAAGPDPTRYGDWEHGGRCTDF